MLKLLDKFNWTYVSFIYEDSEYGELFVMLSDVY